MAHEVFVSGNDDGAYIYCTSEDCMRSVVLSQGSRNDWKFSRVWWTEEIPYEATPEQVVEQAQRHRQS